MMMVSRHRKKPGQTENREILGRRREWCGRAFVSGAAGPADDDDSGTAAASGQRNTVVVVVHVDGNNSNITLRESEISISGTPLKTVVLQLAYQKVFWRMASEVCVIM